MSIKKQIQQTDWQERLQMFSSGNSGRIAAIASQGMTIIEQKPFRDIEYDPIGKGNDLVLSLGDRDQTFSHTIPSPVEIYFHEENNGVISTVEIVDQNGEATYLRLLK